MNKWFYVGALVLFIAIVFALFSGHLFSSIETKEDSQEKSTRLSIEVATITNSEFADFVEAVGSTFAYQSAEITPNVTEVIEKINFEDGQEVKKGDVIVVLRNAEEQALLKGARANLEEQNREIERLSGLVENGAAAVSTLDARRTRKAVAEQQILQYEAQISDRIIRAPFDGVLGLRNISTGSLVSPQNVITTIDDLNTMRVDFTIPEVFLGQVKKNMPIIAKSQAYPNEKFEGAVAEINTRVDPTSRAVIVRAEIPNERHLLKPGMLLYIELALDKTQSLSIPERSVNQEGNRQFAFKISNNVVERTAIELGRRKPGYAEVTAGLMKGDSVATSGLQNLHSDMLVHVEGLFKGPVSPIDPGQQEKDEDETLIKDR